MVKYYWRVHMYLNILKLNRETSLIIDIFPDYIIESIAELLEIEISKYHETENSTFFLTSLTCDLLNGIAKNFKYCQENIFLEILASYLSEKYQMKFDKVQQLLKKVIFNLEDLEIIPKVNQDGKSFIKYLVLRVVTNSQSDEKLIENIGLGSRVISYCNEVTNHLEKENIQFLTKIEELILKEYIDLKKITDNIDWKYDQLRLFEIEPIPEIFHNENDDDNRNILFDALVFIGKRDETTCNELKGYLNSCTSNGTSVGLLLNYIIESGLTIITDKRAKNISFVLSDIGFDISAKYFVEHQNHMIDLKSLSKFDSKWITCFIEKNHSRAIMSEIILNNIYFPLDVIENFIKNFWTIESNEITQNDIVGYLKHIIDHSPNPFVRSQALEMMSQYFRGRVDFTYIKQVLKRENSNSVRITVAKYFRNTKNCSMFS